MVGCGALAEQVEVHVFEGGLERPRLRMGAFVGHDAEHHLAVGAVMGVAHGATRRQGVGLSGAHGAFPHLARHLRHHLFRRPFQHEGACPHDQYLVGDVFHVRHDVG